MKQLKQARKRYKVRQQELAREIGVNQSMISHWEHGRHPLTKEWVLRIQAAIIDILRDRARSAEADLKKLERS